MLRCLFFFSGNRTEHGMVREREAADVRAKPSEYPYHPYATLRLYILRLFIRHDRTVAT